MPRRFTSASLAAIAFLLTSACVPGQTDTTRAPGGEVAPQPEKTLRVAIQTELRTWDRGILGGPSQVSGGANNLECCIVNDGLRRTMKGGERLNLLATEVPDTSSGTWVVKPDGTMDMTWKIVPNAKWHDGMPVTSADFVFTVKLRADPEAAALPGGGGQARLLSRVTALDDFTFVAHWDGVNAVVIDGTGLEPLPRHILEPLYERSKEAVRQSRYFTTEFIGNGPFRLVHWEPGSHMELERFDAYYRGPAKLNRLLFHFIADPNTMAANILSETVDVLLPQGVDVDLALELRERWQREGTSHQVLMETRDGIAQFEIMVNPQYARPMNGPTQQPVRQAMLQAIDRNELMKAMVYGLSEVAYTVFHPDDERYPYVRDLVPPQNPQYQYPYDVRRAEQLLAQAGWSKGPDGVLVHQSSGERFDYATNIRPGSDPFKLASVVQDYWKAIGVNLNINVLTPALLNDNEFLSTRPGLDHNTASGSALLGLRLHSSSIPAPANRWSGNNRGHFTDPAVDSLIERIQSTIGDQEQRALHRQFLAAVTPAIHSLFFYYEIRPIVMLKGVTGPRLVGQTTTNNIWEWDKN